MSLWDALSTTMRTVRRRRIDQHEAERLLSAQRAESEHIELSFLLAAAAAPPRPDELIGQEQAVAAFERAAREAGVPSTPVGRRSARPRRLTRSLAVKAIAGTTAVLVGGVAYAAETGRLPDAAQWHAHDLFSPLGVPAPTGGASPTGSSRTPTPTPTPHPGGETLGPSDPAALRLCRSWRASLRSPDGSPMAAAAFRDLSEVAGGESRIVAFCAALLAGQPTPEPAAPAPEAAPPTTATAPGPDPGTMPLTPSHPGRGKGPGRPTSTPSGKKG